MKRLCCQLCLSALILSLFVFYSRPVFANQASDALETITRAIGLVEQGDADGARTTLAGMGNGGTYEALRTAAQGTAELAGGQTAAAEPFFRAALRQDPQCLSALWGLSLCLLEQAKVYEAAPLVDQAALLAPDNLAIQTLHAYVYLQLGRITDAAQTGKTALEAGEKSAFLTSTLAQIHYRMGLTQKAVEFGDYAAKSLNGGDFRHTKMAITLPLTLTIADTPDALRKTATPESPAPQSPSLPDLKLTLPAETPPSELPRLEITSPVAGSTVSGMQQIQTLYRGRREISFVVLLVDGVIHGMVTELPYQFQWDADAAMPGAHQLLVRAYDSHGLVSDEQTITVTTSSGGTDVVMPASSAQITDLQSRMITTTMPAPEPLSLFTNLGNWHLQQQEIPLAINNLERSAAIDPDNAQVLGLLERLYQENGLHSVSPTGEVFHGPADRGKRIALTFDDGPNPIFTPIILAELAKYDVHSTFFLVGKQVKKYPELALAILANGHELANHSYNHPNLTKLSRDEVISEVLLNRTMIKSVTGRDTHFFRPPGGDIDADVTQELRALDYNIVYWSINAGEYVKYPPAEQAAQILSRVKNGSILLLHDGPVDGTMSFLSILLPELQSRGYEMVTVSELLEKP